MKSTTFALLSVLGSASAQGVTDKIAPKGAAPAGCVPTFNGKFEVSIDDVTIHKRDAPLEKRGATCDKDGILVAGLVDGSMVDAHSRTGYIASNFQFQFDGPAQAGAIYTAGWSVCANGTIALGPSATFYKCQSGDFFNLYDRSWAAQCSPVQMSVMPCGAADPPQDASQKPDGQIVGTTVRPTTVVIPLSDGQPQVITTVAPVPLCQITDGQLQVKTTPCASVTVKPTTTAIPVSQYSDGQIQVTSGKAPPPPPATTSAVSPTSVRTSASTPTGSVSRSSSQQTTLQTTPPPTTSASGTPTRSTTSAVSTAGVGSIEMGSVAALAVGVLGAVWVL